jgi:hypothetical protein
MLQKCGSRRAMTWGMLVAIEVAEHNEVAMDTKVGIT